MPNQKLLKHALVQSNMFNMFEQLLQLQKIIQKICYMCNQLSKLSDTLFKKLSNKFYPLCNSSHVHCAIYSQKTCQKMLSKPCPLQYTIIQTAKKMLSFILQNQYQPKKMSTKSSYILNLKNIPVINKQMYKISTIINIKE